MITKSVIFLLILAFILKIFSSLSIAMGYNANPLYNYSSYSIFQSQIIVLMYFHRRQQCIQQHFPSRMVGTTGIYRIYLGTAKPAYPGNLRIFKKFTNTRNHLSS